MNSLLEYACSMHNGNSILKYLSYFAVHRLHLLQPNRDLLNRTDMQLLLGVVPVTVVARCLMILLSSVQ